MMNYAQTLDYLYARLPMFTRIGAAALKPGLDNTLALCNVLNQPQQQFKSIHIAGTNGKGSVSHMLAAVLQCAGYKTGLYTSPHLRDFRERIRINGAMIPEQTVVDFVAAHSPYFEQIQPSFFEMTMGLSFHWFAQQQVDIAIIETGLGGRLDSTNIINPELAVITNIGWDHMDLLGDTLEKIATEKAGIIKPKTPVVIGEWLPETKSVFEQKAQQENAPCLFAQDHYHTSEHTLLPDGLRCNLHKAGKLLYQNLFCELGGLYQFHNLLTVVAAIEQLQAQGWQINETHLRQGLQQVKQLTGLLGRWHLLAQQPLTICDTGHNVSGITYVVQQLAQQQYQQLHMVIGMVKDKDIGKVLALLPKNARYYFTQANLPRALEAHLLAQEAQTFGLQGTVIPGVKEALATARQQAQPNDLIFIGGSTFVVAEIV